MIFRAILLNLRLLISTYVGYSFQESYRHDQVAHRNMKSLIYIYIYIYIYLYIYIYIYIYLFIYIYRYRYIDIDIDIWRNVVEAYSLFTFTCQN